MHALYFLSLFCTAALARPQIPSEEPPLPAEADADPQPSEDAGVEDLPPSLGLSEEQVNDLDVPYNECEDITTCEAFNDESPLLKLGTGFYGHTNCDNNQKRVLLQAQRDANDLAANVDGKMNWPAGAGELEFFGPGIATEPIRQHVESAFHNIAVTKPKRPADWLKNRYITLRCNIDCNPAWYAYSEDQLPGDKYPTLTFCNAFFEQKPSLRTAIEKARGNQKAMANVEVLSSQGGTFLHELLHMNWGKAQVSFPATDDQRITYGPPSARKTETCYRPFRCKLLALVKNGQGAELAALNSDSYVYYALSQWALKQFGFYPPLPRAASPDVEPAQNVLAAADGLDESIPPEGEDGVPKSNSENSSVLEIDSSMLYTREDYAESPEVQAAIDEYGLTFWSPQPGPVETA
ncbi:MAG: hypothetical protein M1831_003261 [Alyxoria varia]|nr:MAG: hypothetical protein M1831_003261 [Alyxoria varia]